MKTFRLFRKTILIIAIGSFFYACSTSQKNSASRNVAGSNNPLSFVNPKSGKSFWQEYQIAMSARTEVKNATKVALDPLNAENFGPLIKPGLSVFGTWVRANPVATFQDLRKYAPVLELESLPIKNSPYPNKGTIVLSRYRDVIEVLNNPTKFSVRNYQKKMEDSVGPFMLAYDGSQYNMKEKPWMRQMMPKEDSEKIRALVRQLVNNAIEEQKYVGQDPSGQYFGRLELVNEVARKVPIQLSGEYFGFPGPNLDKMYEWSRATQNDFFHNVKNEEEVRVAAVKAGHEMHAYLKTLVAERKAQINSGSYTKDDILSRLIRNKVSEFVNPRTSEDDRLRTNIMGTLVGGVETTQAAIVQSLNQLFLRPQMFEAARQAAIDNRVDLVEKYVWEALRFHPVNPFVVRYSEQDTTLTSGAKIPKGYHVLVATQSAMFDEAEKTFENPNDFKIDRDQSKFFHLGYGHHRCLGDYVGLVEVPEVVMALLKLPNLRPASGQDGQLDFRKRVKTHALKNDDYSTSFPEKFVVEFDASANEKRAVEVGDEKYAYEDYLMNFDRTSYRQCLAGFTVAPSTVFSNSVPALIVRNSKNHKLNAITKDNRELLYCRIGTEFRSCMENQMKKTKFELHIASPNHERAFASCSARAKLNDTEKAFYEHVILGKPLDINKISTASSVRNTNQDYAYEDYLKFYDRFTYRECFMNPAGLSAFETTEMIMYARFNIDFRLCMGKPILVNRYSGGLAGSDREETYEKCKNGVYNESTFKYEGRLSKTEKYFYETKVLKRNVKFEDLD